MKRALNPGLQGRRLRSFCGGRPETVAMTKDYARTWLWRSVGNNVTWSLCDTFSLLVNADHTSMCWVRGWVFVCDGFSCLRKPIFQVVHCCSVPLEEFCSVEDLEILIVLAPDVQYVWAGTFHDSNGASLSSLLPTSVLSRSRSHQPIQWRCTESTKKWLYILMSQVLPSVSCLWSYWGFRLNSQQLHRIPGERDWKRCWRVARSNWSFIAGRSKSVRLWRRERVGACSRECR